MNETLGRQKASDAMRNKAMRLEIEAANWRDLADRLDEMESYAVSQSGADGGETPVPHIGAGSQAESFLWSLTMR